MGTSPARTVDEVIAALPRPDVPPLPAPPYTGNGGRGVGLAVASMQAHMTDEGWTLFAGLRHAGYLLAGHGLQTGVYCDLTDVRQILQVLSLARPGVVVVQDEREWNVKPGDFRDPAARFTHVEALRDRPDVFTLTVLKDAHQRPDYHRRSMEAMGCHAVIHYYHPRVVCRVAPYVRPEHLVRTYHTVDRDLVPPYQAQPRRGCLLSGAMGRAYPLREAMRASLRLLPDTDLLAHPGYHRRGTATPEYLRTLSRYKVAICTSSIYSYALRKLIEATACGCVVVTDLAEDEVLPEIDGNLIRVRPDKRPAMMAQLLCELYDRYDPERQRHFAGKALAFYDFRTAGRRLSADIETARRRYNDGSSDTAKGAGT